MFGLFTESSFRRRSSSGSSSRSSSHVEIGYRKTFVAGGSTGVGQRARGRAPTSPARSERGRGAHARGEAVLVEAVAVMGAREVDVAPAGEGEASSR